MKNKKRLISFILAACLLCAIPISVSANSYTSGNNNKVTFNGNNEMVDNFNAEDVVRVLEKMEPGDDASFSVKVVNTNKEKTNWYMENEVLKSLEDASKNKDTNGGGYEYTLKYVGPSGDETTIFSSEEVGGENPAEGSGEGLHQATNGLEDWFYLGSLASGEQGIVSLSVALDGTTQGNAYQDTLAKIKMNFAVEPESPGTTTKIVKTGDNTNLWLFMGLMLMSLIMMLIVLLVWRKRMEEQ